MPSGDLDAVNIVVNPDPDEAGRVLLGQFMRRPYGIVATALIVLPFLLAAAFGLYRMLAASDSPDPETTRLFDGAIATAPMDATGWRAHTSSQVKPPFVARKIPPSAAPM